MRERATAAARRLLRHRRCRYSLSGIYILFVIRFLRFYLCFDCVFICFIFVYLFTFLYFSFINSFLFLDFFFLIWFAAAHYAPHPYSFMLSISLACL